MLCFICCFKLDQAVAACAALFVAVNLIQLLLRVHYYFHENVDTNLCYGQGKRDECIKTATDKWNCRNIWEKYYINITFVHGWIIISPIFFLPFLFFSCFMICYNFFSYPFTFLCHTAEHLVAITLHLLCFSFQKLLVFSLEQNLRAGKSPDVCCNCAHLVEIGQL